MATTHLSDSDRNRDNRSLSEERSISAPSIASTYYPTEVSEYDQHDNMSMAESMNSNISYKNSNKMYSKIHNRINLKKKLRQSKNPDNFLMSKTNFLPSMGNRNNTYTPGEKISDKNYANDMIRRSVFSANSSICSVGSNQIIQPIHRNSQLNDNINNNINNNINSNINQQHIENSQQYYNPQDSTDSSTYQNENYNPNQSDLMTENNNISFQHNQQNDNYQHNYSQHDLQSNISLISHVSHVSKISPDNEHDDSLKTSNKQMKGLQDTQSMKDIIGQVMEVHNIMTGKYGCIIIS